MTNSELLLTISGILDKKLEPIKNDIHFLKLQNENDILPRLQNMESCYTTTYNRYKNGVSQMETIQDDMDIIKKVITEHSKKLQQTS